MTAFGTRQVKFHLELWCESIHRIDDSSTFLQRQLHSAVVHDTAVQERLYRDLGVYPQHGFLVVTRGQTEPDRAPCKLRHRKVQRVRGSRLRTAFDGNIIRRKTDIYFGVARRTCEDR